MKNNRLENDQKRPADYGKEITAIKNELKEIRESIDFTNEQIALFNENVMSFKDYINNLQTAQTNYLSNIQARLQHINSSVADIPRIVDNVSKIDKIDDIDEVVGNIDYNIRNSASTNGDSEYKQILTTKLSEYEEDLYKKLLRKYVIDTQISLYTQINEQLRRTETNDSLRSVLDLIINKLEEIGVKTFSSKPGDVFNPKCMTTGHYPNEDTDDEELGGKVAESVQPMFLWVLPSIRQQSDQMLLKEEEVTLYHYNINKSE